MKSTSEWLEGILKDNKLLIDWLKKQYCGEVRAYIKITEVSKYLLPTETKSKLRHIANQELQHSFLIGTLIHSRGYLPSVNYHSTEKRYWKNTELKKKTFKELMAVGSHAENMRLVRINAICDHPDTPDDIREVFQHIQKEELWHAKVFTDLSDIDSLEKMKYEHKCGLQLLGLEI